MAKKNGNGKGWTWNSVPKGCGIVTIRRKADRMSYFIGVSDIRQRASDHYRMLQKGTHHNLALQKAWTEEGPDAFEIVAVEVLPREEFLETVKQLCIERAEGRCFNFKNSLFARIRKAKRKSPPS
jgi:hypothetical protein